MNRTLNDIIPPSRRRTLEEDGSGAPPAMPPRPLSDRPSKPPRSPRSGRGFPYGTALIALIVIAGAVAALMYFSGAKVEVTPETKSATVTADFTATAGSGDLPYELVTVEKTASQTVPAESSENVNDPASGKITITNAQAAPQTLIKNTRFQTPDGLIFRIHDSVSIPAGGSIVTMVYADVGGANYNIPATTFTVPGLKGSKAFDQVTAKSTEAMVGGFSGTRASVSQGTRDAQNATNQASLEKTLSADIVSKVPAGYVLIPGATFVTYVPQPDTEAETGKVNVNQKGTMTAVVFPGEALGKAIAYKVIGAYNGETVTLPDVTALKLLPALNIAPVSGETTFTFNLTGTTNVVWKIDTAKIAGAVAGKTRDSAQVILQGFPEVSKASLVLRPFWASTFPQDPEKINVTVVESKVAE
ncbi:MAG: hypothetical protein AB203_00890 [Parcubacteria bacterium C7867-008]|nr:MAG: hypothetical protein AB203_00890 [Parcubacteria bacterium C7867-008]